MFVGGVYLPLLWGYRVVYVRPPRLTLLQFPPEILSIFVSAHRKNTLTRVTFMVESFWYTQLGVVGSPPSCDHHMAVYLTGTTFGTPMITSMKSTHERAPFKHSVVRLNIAGLC